MKSKKKTIFTCQSCGAQSLKWVGRCGECGAWNSMVEELVGPKAKGGGFQPGTLSGSPVALNQVPPTATTTRLTTRLQELDNVLGGGIVPGSLVLVGGDPGIGKSTLLLQMALKLAQDNKRIYYVSGEESAGQIKLRADRLGASPENLWLYGETETDQIEILVAQAKPDVLIVDSIQTLSHPEIASVPGSVAQIRESGGVLMKLAKNQGPAIFLVGHVTKDGQLAGPRVLEHMVDTVLYFEGDKQHDYRILRSIKNRFGSTNEIGIFEMTANGLSQVADPSSIFLGERQAGAAGSVVAASLEGTRPLLVEIQALVATAYFGMPQRRVSGLDYNRACLMLAVLEKRAGLSLGSQDVFCSIAGGLEVDEPAMDLAIAAAVASSLKDRPLPADVAIFGEVGLGGEVRAVVQAERRLQEIQAKGFKRCVLPENNLSKLKERFNLELVGVTTVTEAMAALLG